MVAKTRSRVLILTRQVAFCLRQIAAVFAAGNETARMGVPGNSPGRIFGYFLVRARKYLRARERRISSTLVNIMLLYVPAHDFDPEQQGVDCSAVTAIPIRPKKPVSSSGMME